MKLKILRDTSIKGEHITAHSVVTVDEIDYHALIGMGKAVPVDESSVTEKVKTKVKKVIKR